jgi:hypothetical protein
MATPVPPEGLAYEIDLETSGSPPDLSTHEQNTPAINGFIVWAISTFKKGRNTDKTLWEAYTDEFKEWDERDFWKASKAALRDLYSHLRQHGVYVRSYKAGGYAGVLYQKA